LWGEPAASAHASVFCWLVTCLRRGGNPPAPAFPRRGKRERGIQFPCCRRLLLSSAAANPQLSSTSYVACYLLCSPGDRNPPEPDCCLVTLLCLFCAAMLPYALFFPPLGRYWCQLLFCGPGLPSLCRPLRLAVPSLAVVRRDRAVTRISAQIKGSPVLFLQLRSISISCIPVSPPFLTLPLLLPVLTALPRLDLSRCRCSPLSLRVILLSAHP